MTLLRGTEVLFGSELPLVPGEMELAVQCSFLCSPRKLTFKRLGSHLRFQLLELTLLPHEQSRIVATVVMNRVGLYWTVVVLLSCRLPPMAPDRSKSAGVVPSLRSSPRI